MKTEIGEYIVGAYLKLKLGCDVIDYNVRPKDKGLKGLGELDVIGLRFQDSTVYLCEVTTHLDGIQYGNTRTTLLKLANKFERQKQYADKSLKLFPNKIYQFWAPIVRPVVARPLAVLSKEKNVELIVNQEYTKRVEELMELGRNGTKDYGNPVFRTLQILQHLRK